MNGNINAESLLAFIDSTANVMNESQELNFKRWPILNEYLQQNPVIYGSFAGEVSAVKKFLKDRIVWMDEKMNFTIPTSNVSVTSSEGILHTGNSSVTVYGFASGCMLRIYDLSGKQIVARILSAGSGEISLCPGFYIVEISDGTEQQVLRKLIIR